MIGPTNAMTVTGTVDPSGVTVGSDTKPVKIVNGVATMVANDLVSTTGDQSIAGTKTFTGVNGFNIQNDGVGGHYAISLKDTVLEKDVNPSSINYPFYIRILDKNDVKLADPMGVRFNNNGSGQIDFISPRINGSVGAPDFQILNGYACSKTRTYSASNTYDVVTIGSLQASSDVVHTAGNETVMGIKTMQQVNVRVSGYNVGSFTAQSNKYYKLYEYGENSNFVLRLKGNQPNNNIGWIKVFIGGTALYTRSVLLEKVSRYSSTVVYTCTNTTTNKDEIIMFTGGLIMGTVEVELMEGYMGSTFVGIFEETTDPNTDGNHTNISRFG